MLSTEIARTLEKKLGLGEFPMVRRRLYSRCQRVCVETGGFALSIVAQVLAEAEALRDRGSGGPASVDSKGRFFSKVVVIRLTEQGCWEQGQKAPPPPPPPSSPAPVADPPPPPPAGPRPDPVIGRAVVQHLAEGLAERTAPPPPLSADEAAAKRQAYWEQIRARLL